MLPGEDPVGRAMTAATEREIETIVAFKEAAKKLKAVAKSADKDDADGEGDKGEGKRGYPKNADSKKK